MHHNSTLCHAALLYSLYKGAVVILKVVLCGMRPSQRKPVIKQLKQNIHRLVKASEGDGKRFISHITSQSAHMLPIKKLL